MNSPNDDVRGPVADDVQAGCEQVLRTLPGWFGIEHSLRGYAEATATLPTFVAEDGGAVLGFVSLLEQQPRAWEIHCIAVDAAWRGRGLGRRLHAAAEQWLAARRARQLQVMTLSDSHPSPEYAQTRAFYTAVGYAPSDATPASGAEHLPVLQLVKRLA